MTTETTMEDRIETHRREAEAAAEKALGMVSDLSGAVTLAVGHHEVRLYGRNLSTVSVFDGSTGWSYVVAVVMDEDTGETRYEAMETDR